MKPTEPWPKWAEFSLETAELGPDNVQYKKDIAAEYGEAALRKSWLAVCKQLEILSAEMAEKQTSAIPELTYEEGINPSDELKDRIRKVGCFVVRGTIPKETANRWFSDLDNYVKANKERINGWPVESPCILRLYWSRAQIESRTHPRAMSLHESLNKLWHDEEDKEKTFAAPLSYADAARIRPPGTPFTSLGPHIDAGSLCRWADPTYRKVYDAIWSGNPEKYDPLDLTVRKKANTSLFPGSAHSSVLRLWQGWTALTKAGAHEGSLMLYPDIRTAIAYVLLRPFFQPPADKADIMDAEKWIFDVEDPWFPGVWREKSQELRPDAFPHLQMHNGLVNIPTMYPGDTIWWHCDMCHAIELDHQGDSISSVIYVAATPTTPENLAYVQRQLKAFLDGEPPEDFRGGSIERNFKGYPGAKELVLNGDAGLRAMGVSV
ncbi:hypothetical protein F503_04630 [Ophiostoma piceae UAMH 11346]|uniref:DUF1479-domain-containing protein n=1 Tax=Ophiostoma piceae (strain UAMH 11346) TaxID=1262450 RepID=S3CTU0_OPHP1|nr:hypothetical protein F503_04630 [Ophiostoma piceae UAMH 11346]